MLPFEQRRLGVILEERVLEPSILELKELVSFECRSWDNPLKTSLITMCEFMKRSCCPYLNAV